MPLTTVSMSAKVKIFWKTEDRSQKSEYRSQETEDVGGRRFTVTGQNVSGIQN